MPKESVSNTELLRLVSLKLAAFDVTLSPNILHDDFLELARPILRSYEAKTRSLPNQLCPVDARIQRFLDSYLSGATNVVPRLPDHTLVLDRPGMARLLSLPAGGDTFTSPYLKSYRVPQGVLHNPSSDRRTTKGVFHIAEDGFPVPADKQAVPRRAFASLLAAALRPPEAVLTLPFTANQETRPAHLFVSLLLRPLVCPETATDPAKTMETRFFAPGSLVSNLDFVESIFGNGGDPQLPENDSALDVLHWTGHTGCVILAPHIVGMKKAALGLPRYDDATERQRHDGMCWKSEDEPYNDGNAFKICCRDQRGVMVTIIADNYYGYCKKEVKTQISFAANLFGLSEEEHAGGAIAFATYVLGTDFAPDLAVSLKKAKYTDSIKLLNGIADPQPEGYAIDRRYPDIFYVPEDSVFSVRTGIVQWKDHHLPLSTTAAYVLPSGFRVRIEKQILGSAWRLIGSRPRGTLCHKPCTVSGGGKSEISKSVANALLRGPVFVRDFHKDMDEVAQIMAMDFSGIYKTRQPDDRTRRPILSPDRTLGSVIQLLTPSSEYTEEHNHWVGELSQILRQLVFTVKRYYRPEWNGNWREHFTVDRVNGYLGNEIKFDDEPLVANYLRVGFDADGAWRIFKLRPDFYPAEKVQVEDDITASVVLPREQLPYLDPDQPNPSVKLVSNCETLLFQRPDDAIHRGADSQAELDLATPGTFISNFEPLDKKAVQALLDNPAEFDRYTAPMQKLLQDFVKCPENVSFAVSSAHPRMVNGKPSLNPRYLQKRPDLTAPRATYLAEIATRLERGIPSDTPAFFPVTAVLAGRRNSPPDKAAGLPPLTVHGPIHYQELPELFMEFISSLTGKSPATTGFGSEGALTKGPFNCLWPVVDLNNALVSAILTEYAGFTTSAGWVGPKTRVDHDVSLLVPEIWCRMRVGERSPEFLISKGLLEKIDDYEVDGRTVLASRLGYRITPKFVDRFLGRIFEVPGAVFPEEILRPELQDRGMFTEGIDAIVSSQRRAALLYFEDGSIKGACPPLQALLRIMAYGAADGMSATDPKIRALFTRESLLSSDWYRKRLETKQRRDGGLWHRHLSALEEYESQGSPAAIDLEARMNAARRQLLRISSANYLSELRGTIGADPFMGQESDLY